MDRPQDEVVVVYIAGQVVREVGHTDWECTAEVGMDNQVEVGG